MTINQNELAKSLRHKVERLISLIEETKSENSKLQEENNELKKQLDEKTSSSEELQQKYESLKLAKVMISSSTETHDAKLKVNKLVREIDRCISILNK